ncbi:MAG: phage baseplate assembly protein V [Planctomycetes bacterium]|nr:phage baseplate assembly protein V [Planctomycetota bacterium]
MTRLLPSPIAGGVALTARLRCSALEPYAPAGGGGARVMRADGVDRLDGTFLLEVDAILGQGAGGAELPASLPGALMGRLACLELRLDGPDAAGGVAARWSGVVTGVLLPDTVELAGTVYRVARLRLEPALARWDLDQASDVLPDANPVQTIEELLKSCTGVFYNLGFVATADHPRRQHLVRFQESTAAFVTRLCEEEGLHAYYVHKEDGSGNHTLVLTGTNQHESPAKDDLRPLVEPVASVSVQPFARLVRRRMRWQDGPESVRTADGDCGRFGADLATRSANLSSDTCPLDLKPVYGSNGPTSLKRVLAADPSGAALVADGKGADLVGGTDGKDGKGVGEVLARRAAEEAAGRMRRLQARGDHIGLQAGTVMTLADGGQLSGERFLVVERRLRLLPALTGSPAAGRRPDGAWYDWGRTPEPEELDAAGASWTGEQLESDVLVEAIPLALPYRLPRRHPAPRLAGIHLATVAAAKAPADESKKDEKKKEEENPAGSIVTDALGRVRLQFDWAPKDHLSGWVRVVQGARGLLALPRVGERVAVAFAYGDPGRPLVTGVVLDLASDLPGDPSSKDGSLGRTVLGGLWTGLEKDRPVNSRLTRAPDYAARNEWGIGYLEAGGKQANNVGGSYLALDDVAEGRRGIDLFTAGMVRGQVGGDLSLKVAHKLVIEAGGAIEFRVGDIDLAINRAGLSITYLGKNVPIKSSISLTPFGVEVEAPTVAITGTLRAELNSACSSVKAHLATVTTSAVDVHHSSGIGNLAGLLGTGAEMVMNSCADCFAEIPTETPGDQAIGAKVKLGYFAVKEFMTQVKDVAGIVASATQLGLTPLDIVGGGNSECILGGSFIYATPIDDPEEVVKAGAKAAAKDSAKDAAKDAAKELPEQAVDILVTRALLGDEPFPSDHVEDKDKVHDKKTSGTSIAEMAAGGMGVALGAFETAGAVALAMKAMPITNTIGVKGLSGVRILGMKKDEVLLSEDKAAADSKAMSALSDEMKLKADKTALEATDQAVKKTEQAVSDARQAVQAKFEEVAGDIAYVERKAKGVTNNILVVVNGATGATNKQAGALVQIGPG